MRLVILAILGILLSSCSKDYGSQSLLRTPCGDPYPEETVRLLLLLCDTSTLNNVIDLEFRLRTISQTFSAFSDPRGTFPAVYRATTEYAVQSLGEGAYSDEKTAEALSVAFGKRYLFNLHDHIIGKTPEYHWRQYYLLATRCGYAKTRIATSGINAHLTVDLARAVADAGAGPEFEQDYIVFGDILSTATTNIVQYLRDGYGMETEHLFSGLFLGDILDPVFGEGFTTSLGFQFIRGEAWQYGQYLQRTSSENAAQKKMAEIWEMREALLDEMLRVGLLD